MDEILDYLYGLNRFGIKLGLEVVKEVLVLLDHPQESVPSIHIAGTNGKGSTAAFLASILKEAGYKVGLYTSPHLVKFNERITINGKQITDQELVVLTKLIKEKTERDQLQPTFFEFTTALAFLYFAQEKVDFAVIETGMGGRLDATNVLNPLVSIITNIDLDHTKYLGATKPEIALEKAGIIKENGLVLTAEEDPEIISLFRTVCVEKNAQLVRLDPFEVISSSLEKQEFRVNGNTFEIRLLGEHQFKNALTAVKAIELLKLKEVIIPLEALKKGLQEARWPGRLEIKNKKPFILIDGAHNLAGMKQLSNFLQTLLLRKVQRKFLLLGIAEDKPYREMISCLVPYFEQVVVSKGNFKPLDPKVIAEEVKKYGKPVKVIPNVKEAIQELKNLARADDFILVTGSLYLLGDFLADYDAPVQ